MGLFNFFKRKKKSEAPTFNSDNINENDSNVCSDIDTADKTSTIDERIPTSDSTSIPQEEIYGGMQVAADDSDVQNSEENTDKSDSSDAFNDAPISEKEFSPNYTGRFEINKTKDGKKFFFNLYASNKVGIATSQMYSTAQNALNGVKSVITNAPKAPIEDQSLKSYETLPYPKWEIYIDNGGKFRFRLNASNGSCVCHSQGYTTKTACKNGINSIIRSSRNAEIDKNYLNKN